MELQPLPGICLVVPLTADSARLATACHLLACDEGSAADRILDAVTLSDERLAVALCARRSRQDVIGALTWLEGRLTVVSDEQDRRLGRQDHRLRR